MVRWPPTTTGAWQSAKIEGGVVLKAKSAEEIRDDRRRCVVARMSVPDDDQQFERSCERIDEFGKSTD